MRTYGRRERGACPIYIPSDRGIAGTTTLVAALCVREREFVGSGSTTNRARVNGREGENTQILVEHSGYHCIYNQPSELIE